jgi:hypothetical protein
MANPPIDLPQPAFGVLIVGVLTAIAIAGRPRYDHRHSRAVFVKQKLMLLFQALKLPFSQSAEFSSRSLWTQLNESLKREIAEDDRVEENCAERDLFGRDSEAEPHRQLAMVSALSRHQVLARGMFRVQALT